MVNEEMVRVGNKTEYFKVPRKVVESFSDSKYEAKIVETLAEFENVLRLRRDVFRNELSDKSDAGLYADCDDFDRKCVHLIVTEKESGRAVGTYRLNSYQNAGTIDGFYASSEFCLEQFPADMLEKSVELGRACIAREHRNSKVLFLLWRVMAAYMESSKCRYLFGCCSVFTQEPRVAADVLAKLKADGHVDDSLTVLPQPEHTIIPKDYTPNPENAEIPPLVNIYMRIGAKVCGEPAIDRVMKTVDYFVVFDLEEINRKYRKMFFGV